MDAIWDCMNPPEPPDGFGYVEADERSHRRWVHCCYCGKKAFPIETTTKISDLEWLCQNNKCKKTFKVNIG